MNSILANQPMQQYPPNFKDFVKMVTPQGAKEEIERRLRTGELSQQQFESAKKIANSILSR